jgi:hypothetical protein
LETTNNLSVLALKLITDVHPTSLKEPTWRSNCLYGFALEEQVGCNPTLDPEVRTKNGVDSDSD